jgi:peptide/nickel transport system permease protein
MSRARALQLYVLTRLLLAPLMIWTITTVVFLLLRATPGDPADAVLGPRAPEEFKAQWRQQNGFDLPLWLQYVNYLGGLLRLDLGNSIVSGGKPVWNIIREHFPATAELSLYGMMVALVIGVGAGILSASRPNSPIDVGGRIFGIVTYSVPIFWVGMLLQLTFSVQLGLFPDSTRFPIGVDKPIGPTGLYTLDSLFQLDFGSFAMALYYLTLPALTLGIVLSGIFERIVRVNLKQTLRADYVEAARARGIPERRVLLKHALKNALIPVVTVLGLTLAALLGGAVLTEVTFSWPGLGMELYTAISNRDYSTVQGVIVFFAIIVVIASIAIDLVNAYIDPRIRY